MKLTQPASGATRLIATVSAVMLLMLFHAGAASAHTELLDSTPANGATLDTTPKQIVLTFGEAPLKQGLAMVAVSPDGNKTSLKPQVAGTNVVAPWPQDDSAGAYQVNWRAVADDGHPISGAIKFTIGSASSSSTQPQPTTAEATPASAASEKTGSRSSFPMWVLIPIAALIVILAIVAIRRVRKTPGE